tara:strand:+ start:10294 stop:11229 length:936 start_codon:yes stop_codon:yes gene_type:complete
MSEGLGQYESTIAGFGNATESIKSYVATYDTDFFRNWTEKHNLAMEKLKSAQDISGGIGGSVLAGQLAYKNIKERFQKKAQKKKAEGDEDGDGKPDDNENEPAKEEPTEEEPPAEDEGTPASDSTPSTETSAPETGASPADVQGAQDDEEVVKGFGEDEETPPEAPTQTFEAPSTSGYEPPETGGGAPPTQELQNFGAGGEESTIATGTESTLVTGEGTVVAGEGTVAVAGETATALSGVADTALAVGSFALDAIPVVGILASVGVGLYELFHHPHKAPSAPATVTASSKGEMVLPSFDSVTDTPASSSAF